MVRKIVIIVTERSGHMITETGHFMRVSVPWFAPMVRIRRSDVTTDMLIQECGSWTPALEVTTSTGPDGEPEVSLTVAELDDSPDAMGYTTRSAGSNTVIDVLMVRARALWPIQ